MRYARNARNRPRNVQGPTGFRIARGVGFRFGIARRRITMGRRIAGGVKKPPRNSNGE